MCSYRDVNSPVNNLEGKLILRESGIEKGKILQTLIPTIKPVLFFSTRIYFNKSQAYVNN